MRGTVCMGSEEGSEGLSAAGAERESGGERERRGGSGGVLPQRLLKSRWQKPEVKVIWL